jgi:hypothetical protein
LIQYAKAKSNIYFGIFFLWSLILMRCRRITAFRGIKPKTAHHTAKENPSCNQLWSWSLHAFPFAHSSPRLWSSCIL